METRPHKEEMIRFANSEVGTERHKYKEDGWIKITNTKRTWEY